MVLDNETLKQYLADDPPTIVPLAIKPHFEALSDKEKLYAHHISVYVSPTLILSIPCTNILFPELPTPELASSSVRFHLSPSPSTTS